VKYNSLDVPRGVVVIVTFNLSPLWSINHFKLALISAPENEIVCSSTSTKLLIFIFADVLYSSGGGRVDGISPQQVVCIVAIA